MDLTTDGRTTTGNIRFSDIWAGRSLISIHQKAVTVSCHFAKPSKNIVVENEKIIGIYFTR